MRDASRRQFVKSSIAATFAAGLETSLPRSMLRESFPGETPAAVRADSAAIQKGVLLEMLPDKLSYADRFKMAREVGFEVVQAPTTPDERIAEEIKKAADAASNRIGHEHGPLEVSALFERSRRRGPKSRRHAHLPPQRQALGRGRRAACTRGRRSSNFPPRCLDAVPGTNPQTDSARR